MAEEEVVVARIVGDELQVERYEFQQRSVSNVKCTEGELEGHVRRLRPDLVMWSAPDERGRRLAEALQETTPETEWRPGCIELAGWTHLPFSELLRLMCRTGQQEGERPSGTEEEQEVSAEAPGPPQPAEPAREAAEPAVEAEVEAEEPAEVQPALEAEVEVEEPAGAHPAEQKRDDLGQRLELVLAVRAERRRAEPHSGETHSGETHSAETHSAETHSAETHSAEEGGE